MSDAPNPLESPQPITPESKPWHIFHHLWTQAAYRAGSGGREHGVYDKQLWKALEKFIPAPVEAPPEAETPPQPDWMERETLRANSLRTAAKMLFNEFPFFRDLSPDARIAIDQYIDVMFAPPQPMPRMPIPRMEPVAGVHLVDSPPGSIHPHKRLKMYNYEIILSNFEEIEAGLDVDGKLKVWVTYNRQDYCTTLEDEAAREFLEMLAGRGIEYARQVLEQKLKL